MAHVGVLTGGEWLAAATRRLREDGEDGEDGEDVADGQVELLGVEPAAETGAFAGFIADSLPVRVKVSVGGSERQLPFFMKAIPADTASRTEIASQSGAFRKEAGLYADVFPRARDLPGGAATPPWAPRAYVARGDAIVMDDLVAEGFVELDRRQRLDFDHCALVLEALAAFHADSLALEEREGRDLGRRHPDILGEVLFLDEVKTPCVRWYRASMRAIAALATSHAETLGTPGKKLPEVLRKMPSLVRPSQRYRNVINHGDLWLNNILFRHGEGGRPEAVRFVDFQMTRYAPPAVDIVTFLHLTTRRALREARTADLLAVYHAALRRALARRGLAVDRLLPWDELVASCEEYRLAGMIIAPVYNQFLMITPALLKRALQSDRHEKFFLENRDHEVAECFENDDFYHDLLLENLTELVEGAELLPCANASCERPARAI